MKTNSDKSHAGPKDTCEHNRAFTLVELAVVIVTVAVLAVVILPALADQAAMARAWSLSTTCGR